jgi:cellulose synthase operon protein B
MVNLLRAGLLAIALGGTCLATSGSRAPALAEANVAHDVVFKFSDLGTSTLELHGLKSTGFLNMGMPGDEVVAGATIHLRMTYSPALLPELSHLRVSQNGEVVAVVPMPRDQAGSVVERDVALDPRYFSDYNQFRFDLIGHYSKECELPEHTSLWATISGQSELRMSMRPLELRNELGLLPAPFFDRRSNQRLVLPIVLPVQPSNGIVHAAGIAASWFGMLADYRSARFPVSFAAAPERHSLVFATNDSRPAGLSLPVVTQPTVSVMDHPSNPLVKLLVFQGADAAQLGEAVTGLVLGNEVFTGSTAVVRAVTPVRRAAYDAPRWLTSDRPVKLGELVGAPAELQAQGIAPSPITVNLRLPPDLFTWNRSGIPVDLRYRYTAPEKRDNSMLSISVNDQLLRSYRLPAETESSSTTSKLLVPLLQSASVQQSETLLIPAFQLASNNRMQFQFGMDLHREGLCKQVLTDGVREAIDPDSTIDISAFPHYTAMPNLALFANAGYPFTRFADLSQTALVLPDAGDQAALEQLFFLLGRMGRHTGATAIAYRLLGVEQAERAADIDLLVLSGAPANRLLNRWGRNLPLLLAGAQREYRESRVADVSITASGSLGAFLSFESPVSSGRTVVALAATDSAAAGELMDALEDEGKVARVSGDLTVVRAGAVQSRSDETTYYVGSLPWWQWLWFRLSQHVVLLTLVSLVTAIVCALWIYGWLQRRAAQRLTRASAA